MIKNFDELKSMLASHSVKRRVGVAAAHDEHTLEAVCRAASDGLVSPVLIGAEQHIRRLLGDISFDAGNAEIINETDAETCAQIAAEMAKSGDIDCIMKGKIETGAIMKVLLNREKGIRRSETMSLVAFMESPHYHKVFGITDVALLVYPTLEQKIAEVENAVAAFHRLGIERPKVAVLCAVEKVNPKMRETVDAAAIKERGIPGCIVEGPISFDLAMERGSAEIKGYESEVAGDADILLVPDLVSGNIAAKTITCIGGGRTGGAVYGALVPIMLVSRAATADDKYMSIVVSALTR